MGELRYLTLSDPYELRGRVTWPISNGATHLNPRIVTCVHGLSRNARDFDALAKVLSGEFRVICPDMAGRGRSSWAGAQIGL